MKKYTRACTNPTPSGGGAACSGADTKIEPCDGGPCKGTNSFHLYVHLQWPMQTCVVMFTYDNVVMQVIYYTITPNVLLNSKSLHHMQAILTTDCLRSFCVHQL